jgi:hypothetical protein
MHRTALLALLAAFAVALNIPASVDEPTAPTSESAPVQPRFSFTGGSGTLLGTTDEGELVRIDLDSDTVMLIGDAGAVGGEENLLNGSRIHPPDTLYAVAEREASIDPTLFTTELEA